MFQKIYFKVNIFHEQYIVTLKTDENLNISNR